MKKKKFYLLIPCLFLVFAGIGQVPFTTGNIVVYRVGNNTGLLSSTTAAPVFLDEYTATGVLVQSIAMPTTSSGSNNILTGVGNSMSGMLTLSTNGQYLVLPGISAPVGTTSATTGLTYARVVGRVDYNANINTSTALTDIASGTYMTSAASTDGNQIWCSSGNTTVSSTNGVHYTTLGSTTSTGLTTTANPTYTVNISDGQLYLSANSLGIRIGTVGTGTPISGTQTVTSLSGIPTTTIVADQFIFFDLDPATPGVDVLYFAEQVGVKKYSKVGSTWVSNGTVGTDSYRGLTGTVSGTSVILYITRRDANGAVIGGGALDKITDASGYNGAFSGSPITLVNLTTAATADFASFRGVALVPQQASPKVSIKIFLQGAYNSGLGRHKDVTSTWASILNTNALNQPYNTAPFGNYAGTESVSSGFFASTAGATDILDWVLLELRDATAPSTVIARRAAFVREDGQVVDLDGTSGVKFTGVSSGNYYLVIRHRNHLTVRTSVTLSLDGNVYSNTNTTLYDCTTAQGQAYQNPAITTNTAMVDLGGVFSMWGGNTNSNTSTRASGSPTVNDYLYLVNTLLGGNTATILSNVYSSGDLNLDGTVRASGAPTVNDYLILVNTILGGNTATIINEHQ